MKIIPRLSFHAVIAVVVIVCGILADNSSFWKDSNTLFSLFLLGFSFGLFVYLIPSPIDKRQNFLLARECAGTATLLGLWKNFEIPKQFGEILWASITLVLIFFLLWLVLWASGLLAKKLSPIKRSPPPVGWPSTTEERQVEMVFLEQSKNRYGFWAVFYFILVGSPIYLPKIVFYSAVLLFNRDSSALGVATVLLGLPYYICLSIAAIFLGMGIWMLHQLNLTKKKIEKLQKSADNSLPLGQ